MTDKTNIIEAQAMPVKTVASIELEAEIIEELAQPDPDIAKAMKIIKEKAE